MNSTRILLKKYAFKGEVITKGNHLSFKAITKDNKEFDIEDIKGIKVISIFPDINTSVCDKQTIEIERLSRLHKKLTFISICMNTTADLNKWCLSNGAKNSITLSDSKYKEFGSKTNLYIPKLDKLGRGIIVLDQDNVALSVNINKDLTKSPDYSYVTKLIK